MSEQTLNVNVSVQKDGKKKNVRKAGKTLLIKPSDGVDIVESWFNDLSGVVSVIKTAKTGSYFLTFDNIGNSLEALKSLRKDHEGEILVKFAHYKVFFTMTGLSDDSDYNSIKTKHIQFIEENTDSKVLCISFTSDWLYPTSENKKIVKVFNTLGINVSFIEIETDGGHDSFLLEEPKLFEAMQGFIKSTYENL